MQAKNFTPPQPPEYVEFQHTIGSTYIDDSEPNAVKLRDEATELPVTAYVFTSRLAAELKLGELIDGCDDDLSEDYPTVGGIIVGYHC